MFLFEICNKSVILSASADKLLSILLINSQKFPTNNFSAFNGRRAMGLLLQAARSESRDFLIRFRERGRTENQQGFERSK